MRFLLPLLLALPTVALAQKSEAVKPLTSGRPAPPEQTCYDVLHYDLAIKVLPEEQAIEGSVQMRAKLLAKTDAVVLDLHENFDIAAVTLGTAEPAPVSEEAPFKFKEGEIRVEASKFFKSQDIKVGDVFTVRVTYSGKPRVAPRAPWDGGFQWAKTPSGAHWIATSNQMQGADLWWPCKDQPDDEADSVDIQVTVPEGLMCASNGRLMNATTTDGWSTYHWRVTTPINTYGIALNIAPYEAITRDYESVAGDAFPVTYWVLPENLEKGKVLFEDILAQMAWFESVYGPYPFRGDKYGVVETPHLGMEHQSIIAYGANYQGNPWGADQGFDFLHHHEFAHEWWANLVTCRNWKDFWIHEGFGTYAQSLYSEHMRGTEGYKQRMKEIRRGLRNRAPVAPREAMSTSDVYFGETGGDIYNKGAWVLHSLRFLLGDEKFFVALRRMAYPDAALENTTDGSACRFTDTDEILAIAEKYGEMELDWFFEVYLRQPELPTLHQETKGGKLELSWEVAGDLDFPMPVEVSLDGEVQRVEMRKGKATVKVGDAKEVVVDPNAWLLKTEEKALRRKARR